MANFARLDENNIVVDVITISNDCCLDANGNESEEVGINYCKSLCGQDSRWVQTSRNSNIRGIFAGVGRYYHEQYDVFCNPKPYESWIFNPSSLTWDPPIPTPTDGAQLLNIGKYYKWNEGQRKWETGIISEDFFPKPETK